MVEKNNKKEKQDKKASQNRVTFNGSNQNFKESSFNKKALNMFFEKAFLVSNIQVSAWIYIEYNIIASSKPILK